MLLLVNRADFTANNRQVTQSNYDTGALNQSISDAQFVDVQKLMGLDFYNDMIRNSTDTKYQTLLNGGDYVFQNTTYTNVGLKSVIVFYAYGRYVLFGSATDTPFSFVHKESNDSSRVESSEKRVIAKDNQNIAYNYWENVRNFLDRNATDYPLWKNGCLQKRGVFGISKII